MTGEKRKEQKQSLIFVQEETYNKDEMIPEHQELVQLDLSLKDAIPLQDPSMPALQQEPIQQNQKVTEGRDISRCLPIDANNSLGHAYNAVGTPADHGNVRQIETLHKNTFQDSSVGGPPNSLEGPNPPREKSCTCNFSTKLSLERNKVNPCIMAYKESCPKQRPKHSLLTAIMSLKQHPWLIRSTRFQNGPTSWPSLTLHHHQYAIEKYNLFKTKITKPDPSVKGNPQSQTTTIPVSELNAERYSKDLQEQKLNVFSERELQPFLVRFPVGCFGICLGLGSQTMLWKTLLTSQSMQFLHIPKHINVILWCLTLITAFMVFTAYTIKCIFHYESVRREFNDPIRVNFFFAPWIACLMLAIGTPPTVTTTIHPILWVLFMGPLFALELKIYGQWFSGGKRRLSRVANPSTHLCLVGNFVGALLATMVGWTEAAIFFWAVGFIHYIVLLVTLYQRLPTATVLPKELHPVFFLFVAAPSTASVAWSHIVGQFNIVSRISYFVALFLYLSLVVRINFFRGIRFSVTWWAYTFPMTSFANATIHYSLQVEHPLTQGLAAMFSFIASIAFLSLCFLTVLHLCGGTMFPNDEEEEAIPILMLDSV